MDTGLLKNLASLAQNLNEASDLLSQQIAHVESVLNELKLGVFAWVELARYEIDMEIGGRTQPVEKVEELGYGKHQGRWGLLYSTHLPGYPDEFFTTVVPLRDAPRIERIRAVDKLPQLLEALEEKAVELTELARAKAAEVAHFAQALKGSAS